MNRKFIQFFEDSIKKHWNLVALTNYAKNQHYTYGDMAKEIKRRHLLFEELGIQQGDHVALVGPNSPEWVITFIATITYGAVIVPILPDFHPNDIHNIVNHSEAKLMFVDKLCWNELDQSQLNSVRYVLPITQLTCLHQAEGESLDVCLAHLDDRFKTVYPNGLEPENLRFADKDDEEVAVINYTSGTTGFSKGVMLTGDNFCCLIEYAERHQLGSRGDRVLSFLPLAHMFGCVNDLFFPLSFGEHITFLTKIPTPKAILKAMGDVKPNWISSVPIFLEAIYKKAIAPQLKKRSIRLMTKIPVVSNLIYGTFRKKLLEVFGGELNKIFIGGAPLNREVEDFLLKIKFPFSIGYGMTECAPIICADIAELTPHSVGHPVEGAQVKVDSDDPIHVEGEILVKGRNVMKGYFRNEEATQATFTEDGWLKTGDVGLFDKAGNLFIRGRCKNMFLSATGQNIYPEEIEAKLSNLPYVAECVVVQRENKIVALVYPNFAEMEEHNIPRENLASLMEEHRKALNPQLAAYEYIDSIVIHPTEFEKTPKRSIKRYKYK